MTNLSRCTQLFWDCISDTCTRTHTHTHTHTHTNTHTHIQTHARTRTHLHVHAELPSVLSRAQECSTVGRTQHSPVLIPCQAHFLRSFLPHSALTPLLTYAFQGQATPWAWQWPSLPHPRRGVESRSADGERAGGWWPTSGGVNSRACLQECALVCSPSSELSSSQPPEVRAPCFSLEGAAMRYHRAP